MSRTPACTLSSLKIAVALAVLLAVNLICPEAYAGSQIEIAGLRVQSDTLFVQFEIQETFFDKLIETVERGLSATIRYTIELWEPRRGWFDKLAQSGIVTYRIRYDSWSEEYVAVGPEGELDTKPSPGELWVCRAGLNEVPVCGVGEMDPANTYYIHLSVEIQPLTVEEVREIEVWLRGTWERSESGTSSRTKGISKGVFDLVKNLTGFGDEVISTRSGRFSLDQLR